MTGTTGTPAVHTLQADSVVFRRGGRTILDRVTVTATAGRVLAVTGPSGAGKSTLLACLAGLTAPTEGQITVDGRPLTVGDDHYLRRVGLILQGYGLISVLTAAENVELVLQSRRVPAAETGRRAVEALEQVGLAGQANHLAETLSGGQQQRLAIARALVDQPQIVIADEPTAELDTDTRNTILQLLRDHASRGTVVIIATHDPEVTELADDEIGLRDGRTAAMPSPMDIRR